MTIYNEQDVKSNKSVDSVLDTGLHGLIYNKCKEG